MKLVIFILSTVLWLNATAQLNFQHIGYTPDKSTLDYGSFLIGDKYYMIGGHDTSGNNFGGVREYDIKNNHWSQKLVPPFVSGAAFGASTPQFPFIVGGVDTFLSTYLQTSWKYDPVSDTWTSAPPPPSKTVFACTFSYGRYYYHCFGDSSAYRCRNMVWRFDTLLNIWQVLPDAPMTPRSEASAVVSGQYAYIVGGRTCMYKSLNEIWRFDMQAEIWDSLPPIPNDSGRGDPFIYAYKNMLIVCFGVYQDALRNILYVPNTTIYKLDLNTRQWSLVTYNHVLSPGASSGGGYFQYGTKCYLLGGARNLDYSLFYDMWMFDAAALGAEVDSTSTGVGDPELSSDFKIFPNPLREGQKLSVICRESGELTLYSVLGQEVHKSQVNAGLTTIDMITLSNQRELLFYKVVYDKGGNQSGKISLLKQ